MTAKSKTIVARIEKTRHKQPFTVTFDGRVDTKIKLRYSEVRDAARGAARYVRDQLKADISLRIIYPDGRYRFAFWSYRLNNVCLGVIQEDKPKNRK